MILYIVKTIKKYYKLNYKDIYCIFQRLQFVPKNPETRKRKHKKYQYLYERKETL